MQISHADAFAGDVTSPEFRGGGKEFRTLLKGRDGEPGNYRLVYARQTGAVSGPRHRHNFEQFRYCVSGRVNYGKDCWIEEGEIAYFPEGAWYGPEESDVERLAVTIQFGGPSGHGFVGETEQLAAMEELKKAGVFEKGVWRRSDNPPEGVRRNQDSFEAIWEHINKRRIEYPPPRYDAPVLARPRNFAWTPVEGEPGVARRALGRFTERNVEAATMKLDPGARTNFAVRGGERLGFVLEGRGEIAGQGLRAHSAFALAPGETASLAASEAMELLVVGLPEFA